jgi:hypothetical protein
VSGESDTVDGLLGGAQLDRRVAGVVIDSNVGMRPAGALASLLAVLQDPLSDMPEAAQFLDI